MPGSVDLSNYVSKDELNFYISQLKSGAEHAQSAYTLDEDSPVLDWFISKISDDVAHGFITFELGFKALATVLLEKGAEFGKFVPGMIGGTGAKIDAGGNAEVESLRVRTSMWVQEMIINRLRAIEGDQIFTESDTIESVEELPNNCYRLTLQKKYEGYFTGMTPGAVLMGKINNLAQGGGTFYTSWMRVNSVNTTANTIEVSLYPVEDTPEGQGYEYADGEETKYCPPPCELMTIARWGHQTDETRQRLFYLSSIDGRFVRFEGVTKPIIDFGNYATILGRLPDNLNPWLPIELQGSEGIYVKTICAQNIIQIDHQGNPKPVVVDRGPYDPTATYYAGDTKRPETAEYEQSDVWYKGVKWRCCKTGTTKAPAWNLTDWVFIEGNPDFTVEFADTDVLFDPDNFHCELRAIAKYHGIDVTADILPADIEWTRYSEDKDGNPRVASDNAWAVKYIGAGPVINLINEDADFNGYIPKVLRFKISMLLREGGTEMQEEAAFEYSR